MSRGDFRGSLCMFNSAIHFDNVVGYSEMMERRAEVVARLKALEEAAAPLINFLQNSSAVQELRADKQHNLQLLQERYQVSGVILVYIIWNFLYLKYLLGYKIRRRLNTNRSCPTANIVKTFSYLISDAK